MDPSSDDGVQSPKHDERKLNGVPLPETLEDVTELTRRLETLKKENFELKSEFKDIRDLVRNTRVVFRTISKSEDEHSAALTKLAAEIQELKDQLAQKEKEFEKRQHDYDLISEVVQEKQQENESREARMAELEGVMEKNHEQMLALQAHIERHTFQDWYTLIADWQRPNPTRDETVRRMVHARLLNADGIPDSLRGPVWYLLSGAHQLRARFDTTGNLYYTLLERDSKSDKWIAKDVDRSFPNREFRVRMNRQHRIEALSNVLRAYSNWDVNLGYCQGLNFIAGMLLLYLDQEFAFWLLVAIMHNYKLVGLFQNKSPILPLYMNQFQHELQLNFPSLHEHFKAENLSPMMYVTEWLTTMFVYNLPRDSVARIWDIFFHQDGPTVLFRCGLALLAIHEAGLMYEGLEDILTTLKREVKKVSAKALVAIAHTIKLSNETTDILDAIEVYWESSETSQGLISSYIPKTT